MKKFGLFIEGLIALFLLLANVGPLDQPGDLLGDPILWVQAVHEVRIDRGEDCVGISLHYHADRFYFPYPGNIGTGLSLCSLPGL